MEKLSLGVLIGASIASQLTQTMSSVSKQLQGLGKLSREIGSKQIKLNGLNKAASEAKTAFAAFEQAKNTQTLGVARWSRSVASATHFGSLWRTIKQELRNAALLPVLQKPIVRNMTNFAATNSGRKKQSSDLVLALPDW